MTTFGRRIRAARLAADLTQTQLAKRAGIAQAALSRIERDETYDPGLLVMAGLAQALDLSVDTLIDGHDLPRTPPLRSPRRHRKRRSPLENRVVALEAAVLKLTDGLRAVTARLDAAL